MSEPWGIHRIGHIYHPNVSAGLPDGRWVRAVAVPYPSNIRERLRAAWWVLTGRAEAFIWPKPGDLERALSPAGEAPQPRPVVTEALRESIKQLDAIIEDGMQTDFKMWRDDLRAALASPAQEKETNNGKQTKDTTKGV